MKIIVNGNTMDVKEQITIQELIDILEIKAQVVAISLNLDILKKQTWQTTTLKENDSLELLHFMGGGSL